MNEKFRTELWQVLVYTKAHRLGDSGLADLIEFAGFASEDTIKVKPIYLNKELTYIVSAVNPRNHASILTTISVNEVLAAEEASREVVQ